MFYTCCLLCCFWSSVFVLYCVVGWVLAVYVALSNNVCCGVGCVLLFHMFKCCLLLACCWVGTGCFCLLLNVFYVVCLLYDVVAVWCMLLLLDGYGCV